MIVRIFTLLLAATTTVAAVAADNPQEKQAALIATLKSEAPKAEKAIACKQLLVYGDAQAVSALAALLPDKDLSSWARIALEGIPGPEADAALREALDKVQGRLLIGVINSIGYRRDAKAVEVLAARLTGDEDVAAAAAVALGKIGGEPAAAALEKALAGKTARTAVAQGCVLCAERLLADGKTERAIALYDAVRKADVPRHRVIEATRGAIVARKAAGIPILLEQLRSSDKAFFNLGLTVARELPGTEVTEALVAEFDKAQGERQGLILLALADRGDAAALPAVLKAAKDGGPAARLAAIRVLARIGNARSVPVLLEAAAAEGEIGQAAVDALAEISGDGIDADLAARLEKAEGKARQALITLVGRRNIATAVPGLLKAADDADPAIRSAALLALGETISPKELPALIGKAVGAKADDKAAEEALRAACQRMPDRDATTDALVAAMAQAPTPAKIKLLEMLGVVGGKKAAAALGQAGRQADPEIQDAATRVLGEWLNADAAPALLDLAKNLTDAKFKVRALRGYLRIARQLEVPLAERMAMCRIALPLADRDEEKKLVLEALRRYPTAEGIALAASLLSTKSVKADAALTAVAIGEKLAAKDPVAVAAAMQQVLGANPDAAVAGRAKALLKQTQRRGK